MTLDDATRQLLNDAIEVLDHYRYWSDDGDEGNNEDVIELIDRIEAHLAQYDGREDG